MSMELNWDKVEYIRRNQNSEHHCDILNPSDLKITKPTVLCLSGNGALDLSDANGIAKQAEVYLELLFKDKNSNLNASGHVDLIGVKYARNAEKDDKGFLTKDSVQDIVNRMLLPLLLNNDGKRLPINEAQKNMAMVNFLTYCAGTKELTRIIKDLNIKLKMAGYSDEEIRLINKASINVAFAPYDKEANFVPSIRVISTKDETMMDELNLGAIFDESFNGIGIYTDSPGRIYGKIKEDATAGSITILTGQLLNGFFSELNEHNIGIVSRNEDWEVRKYKEGTISHNADCVSQMMAWSLSRAVENSMKNIRSDKYVPNSFGSTLLLELRSIKDSFKPEQLSINSEYEESMNRQKFDKLRDQKVIDLAVNIRDFKPDKDVFDEELKNTKTFVDVYILCEKYSYYYLDDVLKHATFLTPDEKLTINILGKGNERRRNKIKMLKNVTTLDVLADLMQANNLDEIRNVVAKYDGKFMEEAFHEFICEISDNEKKFLISSEDAQQILTEYNEIKGVKFRYLVEEFNRQHDFEGILKVAAKYNENMPADKFDTYTLAAGALVSSIKSVQLTQGQINLLKSCNLHANIIKEKIKLVKFPTYDEMLEKINNADSYEAIVEYLKKYDYFGVEYVLPAVEVLTEKEKDSILELGGKLKRQASNINKTM